MIKSTLKWLDFNIFDKKTWQAAMIDKDNCTFSVAYSLLKIKVKHMCLKISLKFLEICSKYVFAWV